jgi:ABC-type nitrate/sulfonate/bicarbonate transport system ATPase subunit
VDEALLLADRIAVLGPGPGATLGTPIPVGLARPRERKRVHREPRYKQVRAEVLESLVSSTRRAARSAAATGAALATGSLEVVA